MRTVTWADLDADARASVLTRGTAPASGQVRADVERILDRVRVDGDLALRALTQDLDGADVPEPVLPPQARESLLARVDPAVRRAIADAAATIRTFHADGAPTDYATTTVPGVECRRVMRPIRRVALYVPAGSAPLPSTALMLGVPAQLAGCPSIALVTPPGPDGLPDATVIAAAAECGIEEVVVAGGAQAVAALTFGTDSIRRADKIFGPGNAWVTEAKRQVAGTDGGPGIDLPAGPSEVVVVADAGADPEFVAADLLSQAEHGPDSQVLLLTDSADLAAAVVAEVEAQVSQLPREDVAREALASSAAVVAADIAEAIAISNEYAPEHLILALRDADTWVDTVERAGSVFLGDHTPESLGDYSSGTNHVLPTAGAARWTGGVSVASFQIPMTVQRATPDGLAVVGPVAVTLARAEGLEAHARAVTRRLERTDAGRGGVAS